MGILLTTTLRARGQRATIARVPMPSNPRLGAIIEAPAKHRIPNKKPRTTGAGRSKAQLGRIVSRSECLESWQYDREDPIRHNLDHWRSAQIFPGPDFLYVSAVG